MKHKKEELKKLSDEDQVKAWELSRNSAFKDLVKQARKDIGIPKEGWKGDFFNNYYGVGPQYELTPLYTTNDKGRNIPYGDWVKRIKIAKNNKIRVDTWVENIKKEFPYLDEDWNQALSDIICYGKSNFMPSKIVAYNDEDGNLTIKVKGYLKSKRQLLEWIENNWDTLKGWNIEHNVKRSKGYVKGIPDIRKWDYYSDIVKMRAEEHMRYSDIADVLSEKYPDIDTSESRINEDSVKNAFHRLKKLQKLIK